MSDLKQCPCGKIPEKIYISENGNGEKWAVATGTCCDEWMIEFRNDYNDFKSAECMERAIEAWNNAPRKLF